MWIVLLSGVLVAVASKNITRNYPTPNAGVVSDFKSIGEFPISRMSHSVQLYLDTPLERYSSFYLR